MAAEEEAGSGGLGGWREKQRHDLTCLTRRTGPENERQVFVPVCTELCEWALKLEG